MNNLLEQAYGIDKTIQEIQERLYDALSEVWCNNIEGYGRVEKTPINAGDEIPDYYRTAKLVIPEWYNATKKDYEEVYYDDKKSCIFCFLTSDNDETLDGVVYTAKVKCVFMVNLEKIFTDGVGRLTAKAHKEASETLRNLSYGIFDITGIERRIDIIFQEYKTNHIQTDDMHPLHVFAIKIDLNYILEDSCN